MIVSQCFLFTCGCSHVCTILGVGSQKIWFQRMGQLAWQHSRSMCTIFAMVEKIVHLPQCEGASHLHNIGMRGYGHSGWQCANVVVDLVVVDVVVVFGVVGEMLLLFVVVCFFSGVGCSSTVL